MAAVLTPLSMQAAILYQATNVTWAGGSSNLAVTPSTPMTKTDTYYIQYTVEITSSVPPGSDGNIQNPVYPDVRNPANAPNGGGAFRFVLGANDNDANLLMAGFSTSSWHTNQWTATNGNQNTLVSTGTAGVVKYSTRNSQTYPVVKYQTDITLNMSSGKYDYKVTQLDGQGNIVGTPVTLTGLGLNKGNYWDNNNPNKTFSQLFFESSTTQMTMHFDRIIVSTDPIIPVPEPGTTVLAGAGIAFLSLSRRRRKP